jgi:hypothetical protein
LPLFCVAAQSFWQSPIRIEQRESNGTAGFGKVAGGDETVATVAAGATQHGDGASGVALQDLPCDGRAGILRQLPFRGPGGHCPSNRFAHLADVEKGCVGVHEISHPIGALSPIGYGLSS